MGSFYNFLRDFTEKWPVKGFLSSLKTGIFLQITNYGKREGNLFCENWPREGIGRE